MTQIWDINLTTHIVRLTDIAPDSSRRDAEFRLLNHGEVSFFDISHTLELEISSEDYSEICRKICAEGSTNPVTSIALEGIDLIASFLQVKVEFRPNQAALRSATICVHSVRDVSVRFSTNIQGVFIGGASFTKSPSDRPAVCEGCRFYDGSSHGGNKLICGMHPSGYAGRSEKCPDWEAGDKYKRDLEITRVNEFRSLSDSVRERIQVTQEQMRLAGNLAQTFSRSDFRESSDLYRVIADGRTTRNEAAYSDWIEIEPEDAQQLRLTLRPNLQSDQVDRFRLRIASAEYPLRGFAGTAFILASPTERSIEAGSSWALLGRDVAYQQARLSDSIGGCDCLACQRERLRESESIARPNYRRDYRMSGFPIYELPSEYQEWFRPRIEIRLPRFTVQATNTARPSKRSKVDYDRRCKICRELSGS